MNGRTALTVVLALLAVAALAVAAATLDTATTDATTGGFGGSPSDDAGVGAGDDGPFGTDRESGDGAEIDLCVPTLLDPRVQLGIVAGFALLAGVVYWRTRTVVVPAAVVVAVGVPTLLVYALLTACGGDSRGEPPSLGADGNGTDILPEGGGATGLSGAAETATTPSVALGVLLVVALLGSALLLFVSTGDREERTAEVESDPEPSDDVAAVGRVAGRAADRIEDSADVDNEVFRAWREMTGELNVERPASSTPGEFAAAATDAGMAREDVAELTRLFEDVRYGDAEPTADREERAVAALRRIEAEYADAIDGDADAIDGDADAIETDTNAIDGDRDGDEDGGDRA